MFFISLSYPAGVSTGTVVGLSALDPSSCDQPYVVGSIIGSFGSNSGVNIVLMGWPCLYQIWKTTFFGELPPSNDTYAPLVTEMQQKDAFIFVSCILFSTMYFYL